MAGLDMAEFEGAGERYKFLLQPVKDLAANWDLDIAKTLEEYIRKVVEEITNPNASSQVDEHGRHKVFNFAEAALLIHGTTTVYVRKVEYVLQQAQNFFEQLREDNSRDQQKGKRRKGAAQEEDGGFDGMGGGDGNDENLDPNVELGQQRNEKRRQSRINYTSLRHLLERLGQRQASLLPVVPIAFFPLSDFEKTDVPLCTRTNPKEIIGKKDDFKINACHIHESVALLDLKSIPLIDQFSQLRVDSQKNDANRGPSTVLEPLLERTIEDDIEASSSQMKSPRESIAATSPNRQEPGEAAENGEMLDGGGEEGMAWDEDDALEIGEPMGGEQQEPSELGTAIEGTQEDMDEEMGRLRSDANSFPLTQRASQLTDPTLLRQSAELLAQSRPISTIIFETDENQQQEGQHENEEEEREEEEEGQDKENQPTQHRRAVRGAEEERELDWEEQLSDLLDPMELVNDRSRPFRRNEKCVMNASKQIKARERRIEKECREKGIPNMDTVKCYIDTRIYRHKLKKKAFVFGQFNTFLVDDAIHALNPLIHEEEKRRSELRKRRRKEIQIAERAARAALRESHQREMDPVLDHPNEEDEDAEQQNEMVDGEEQGQQEQHQAADEFDDPLEELVAEEIINLPAGEDWASEIDQDEHHNLGDILEVEDLENSLGGVQNLYAGFEHLTASQKKRNRFFGTKSTDRNLYDDTIMVEGALHPDDLPPRPISQMDYDEIIAFHLRKYWTASEEAISAFSERIHQWEVRMTELLAQEQMHREFCTRDYGDELLERFGGQIGAKIDFTKMLGELPNEYDQSRYLLVSLILANMNNVEIELDDNDHFEEESFVQRGGHEPMETERQQDGSGSTGSLGRIRLKLLKLERHHQVFDEEQRLLDGAGATQ